MGLLYTDSSRGNPSAAVKEDDVLPNKRWLELVLRNLLCASAVTSIPDGDLERFWDFLIKHLSEDDIESSILL